MNFKLTSRQRKVFWALLIVTVMVRLLSLGSYPLADTTEARYAEIARLMAQTGDWITPQIHQGVPFWGKPPLSTWLSALSIRVLGVHEFAIRLPSLLISLAVIFMTYSIGARQRGWDFALIGSVILATSVLFFVSSGAVMTDPSLLLGTTVSMVAFWYAMTVSARHATVWGYLFFVGLAIGLLAKGPVALILVGLPIGIWIIWKKQWSSAWHRIPWVTGLMLCLLLCIPWYYMAELKTPGFLDYFLIGEHWKRFLISGWQGDLYGNAHSRPLGTIWLYWLITALPWSMVFLLLFLRKGFRKKTGHILKNADSWCIYLALWAITPMIFFTLSGNILWTYILPGLPAFALLMAELLLAGQSNSTQETNQPIFPLSKIIVVATTIAILFISAWFLIAGQIVPPRKCQKELVMAYQNVRKDSAAELAYLFKRPYSAEFYSKGKARLVEQTENIDTYLHNGVEDFFALKKKYVNRLPEEFLERVEELGTFNGYYLLKDKSYYDG